MLPKIFSFVDIETTGANVTYNRIIEIGIIRTEQGKIKEKFESLINPQTHIDPFIEKLTGIKRSDLDSAPTFREIQDRIMDILKDSIFVAHNVRFDYGFLRNEYKRCGINFTAKHLCTVKLARILYPGYRNYDLDSIIGRHHITCRRRHRAFDDAYVIWEFFRQSRKNIHGEIFVKSVNSVLKKPSIPSDLSPEIFETIPESPGVYIFYGEKDMPLYIGKSINIKDRISSHFSADHTSSREMKIARQVKHIETIPTAGELGALLMESSLIKRMQPIYNRVLRRLRKMIILKKITDEDGYFTVEKIISDKLVLEDMNESIGVFKSDSQMKEFLFGLAKEYRLCNKILGLEKTDGYCFRYQLNECKGACQKMEPVMKYNLRFHEAFFKNRIKPWPFEGPIVIREKGDNEEYFIIDKWCLLGNSKNEIVTDDVRKDYSFDLDTYKILCRYLSKKKNYRNISRYNSSSFGRY